MSNSGLSPAAPIGAREPPTDKTYVVSMLRQVQTNWVSGRALQPSTEPNVANLYVPSDFLEEGKFTELWTLSYRGLDPLNIISTWFLPLEKRKTLSSVMDEPWMRLLMEHRF